MTTIATSTTDLQLPVEPAGQQIFLAAVTVSKLRYGAADNVFSDTPGLTLHQ